ncbi:conserved exported hypothetical protein [Candidatus Sulfobium mesophilum]|uniref:Uncharacterized protein n=1 Tax=Candidatus Sulfobium mesophilum TaxID=2016548 RepID=A0A2U3QGR3_9BACT|nr:conserved exported hypothetical protein [Candidatus Sulfobium mesophilum]
MKSVKCCSLPGVLLLAMGIWLLSAFSGTAHSVKQSVLTDEDCVKCHSGPPADIAVAGGKHKSVGCSGCHIGHPPTVKKPVPKCSMCHMGKPHFEMTGCLSCHRNPHTPLNISFAGNAKNACLSCHTRQTLQLRNNKSKHSGLNCPMCHSVHRKAPLCTQCHKPHSAEMAAADCRNCHKAHVPNIVTYASGIPSKGCGSCHKRALEILSASMSKHMALTCAFCHKEKHRMIPDCLDCHVRPHQKVGIVVQFSKCDECHNVAHDLNYLSAAKQPR